MKHGLKMNTENGVGMKDFTVKSYSVLLDSLIEAGYEFQTFTDYQIGRAHV